MIIKEMDSRLPPQLRAVNRPIAPRWYDESISPFFCDYKALALAPRGYDKEGCHSRASGNPFPDIS